jgi:hypothetical protein
MNVLDQWSFSLLESPREKPKKVHIPSEVIDALGLSNPKSVTPTGSPQRSPRSYQVQFVSFIDEEDNNKKRTARSA